MQYILTEDEMAAHRQKVEETRRLPSPEKLQEFCTMVANTIPVADGWAKGKVWNCILTTKHTGYCDECPAKGVCPYPHKEWSK